MALKRHLPTYRHRITCIFIGPHARSSLSLPQGEPTIASSKFLKWNGTTTNLAYYLLFKLFYWTRFFSILTCFLKSSFGKVIFVPVFLTFFARFFLTCFLNLAAGNSLQPSPPLEMHPCPPLPSALGEKEWISCLFSCYKFTTSRTSQNESNPRITTCPKLLLPPASAAQRLLAPLSPRPFLLLAEKRRLWSFIWNFTTLKSEQCTIIFGQAYSISQLLTFELCMFEQW